MSDFITKILLVAFVIFWVWKTAKGVWFAAKRRKLWAGSVPIDDEGLREWYTQIWWETYKIIAPEDRVNHEPTSHWWLYLDHTFLPTYLGERLIGWWSMKERAIFVTKDSLNNRNLVRHECAHDIMNSIEHREKYFSSNTYVMKQFQ